MMSNKPLIKTLSALHKVKDFNLKQLKMQLKTLEEKFNAIEMILNASTDRREMEKKNITLEGFITMHAYLEQSMLEEKELHEKLKKLTNEMDTIKQEILLAFQDLKQNDIIKEDLVGKLNKEEAEKENAQMDELSMVGFFRKTSS